MKSKWGSLYKTNFFTSLAFYEIVIFRSLAASFRGILSVGSVGFLRAALDGKLITGVISSDSSSSNFGGSSTWYLVTDSSFVF